jgi:sterol desaturase/sphingolipid hydroxylase (fatty acid hydroxylase superfamily)
MIKSETDSNYSTIFSFWDRLHKTIRLNIYQEDIVTGVPAYADEKELTIVNLLKLPFTKIRAWRKDVRPTVGDAGNLKP